MADINTLKQQIADQGAKLDELQGKLDTEQEQVTAAVQELKDANTALQEINTQLQAIIDAGGVVTAEQLQEISDSLTQNTDKITSITGDLETTIEPATPAPDA